MAPSKRKRLGKASAQAASVTRSRRKKSRRTAPQEDTRYKGWVPLGGNTIMYPISKGSLSPKQFWARYTSQRRPVALVGGVEEGEFAQMRAWTLEYLKLSAKIIAFYFSRRKDCLKGGEEVAVEWRRSAADTFGKGHRKTLLFSKFVEELQRGNDNLYLTTQESAKQGSLLEAPLKNLRRDFPLRPTLTGRLIPQSINLWLGSSKLASASGLHHDYHDNLYILLEGTKTFQLWSPALVWRMYTHGKPMLLHENGRIVYEGQGALLADGSFEGADCEDQSQAKKAEEAVDSDEELEHILDVALAHQSDNDDSRNGDQKIKQDDYESSDEEMQCCKEDLEPPSFSRVDMQQSPEAIASDFPHFPGMSAALTCTLNAGQDHGSNEGSWYAAGDVLYLPAGWFHNVTSKNAPEGRAGAAYHLAVNYWFHPPDHLDAGSRGFSKPYCRDFWAQRWAKDRQRWAALEN